MKKSLMFALAILLAIVSVAIPASADNRSHKSGGRNSHRSDRHRGGYAIQIPQIHVVGGGYYDSYGYGYGRGLSRREVVAAATVIGGVLVVDKVVNRRRDGDSTETESPSKCFERVTKNARKQHVQMDARDAMAFCSGQPLTEPEPRYIPQTERSEPMPQAPPQAAQAPAPMRAPTQSYTVSRKPRGVYLENGMICNDENLPLTILVDGREVGIIAPGGTLTMSRLPSGKVCYVQAGKSSCVR